METYQKVVEANRAKLAHAEGSLSDGEFVAAREASYAARREFSRAYDAEVKRLAAPQYRMASIGNELYCRTRR